MAGYVLDGAISQYPSGWLASCTIWFFAVGVTQIIAVSCLFGFITVPIHSVATAHAHDFAASDERVKLSEALRFYFAVGAIASPIMANLLIQEFGAGSFFLFIASAYFLLAVIAGLHMLLGDVAHYKTPYIYSPRTSFLVGQLTKILRDPGSSSKP